VEAHELMTLGVPAPNVWFAHRRVFCRARIRVRALSGFAPGQNSILHHLSVSKPARDHLRSKRRLAA
jgi:hypothetical protein